MHHVENLKKNSASMPLEEFKNTHDTDENLEILPEKLLQNLTVNLTRYENGEIHKTMHPPSDFLTHSKGLFTCSDAVTVTVPVPVKVKHCVIGDGHFDWMDLSSILPVKLPVIIGTMINL